MSQLGGTGEKQQKKGHRKKASASRGEKKGRGEKLERGTFRSGKGKTSDAEASWGRGDNLEGAVRGSEGWECGGGMGGGRVWAKRRKNK